MEYQADMAALATYMRTHAARLPYIIWRDASVQHFETVTGDFNGAAEPFECRPIGGDPDAVIMHPNGSLSSPHPDLQVRALLLLHPVL